MKKNLQGLLFFLFLVASVFRKFSENRWNKAALCVCLFLLVSQSASAQVCFSNPPDNISTTMFYTCAGGLSFRLSSNSNNDAPSGPKYEPCSTSGPRSKNTQWLIVKATDNGQIQLSSSLTTGSINIWVWGGFDAMPSDCTKLTSPSICGQYDHNDAITPFTVIKDKYYVILLAGMTGSGPTFTISGTGPANIPAPTVISQSRCGSGPVTLTASGAKTGEKYNWYDSSGALVQSGTNAQFTTPSLSTTTQYTVTTSITTNTSTSCESDPATVIVTINDLPAITGQPVSASVCQGSNLTLTVTATGSADLTYQWRKGGASIPGATAISYTIPNAAGTDAGSYDVVINNSCGSITSDPAVVAVNPVPSVTVPANSTVCPGAAIPVSGFSSSLSGTTYSWTNSNTAIGLSAASGNGDVPAFTATNSSTSALSSTITVTPALNGCTGNPVSYTVTVKPQPLVTVPTNITVCSGTIVPSSNFIGTPAGADFSWSNSNTSIGLADAGGVGNVHSFTAINNTSSPVTSTITVTPTINGCTGPPSTYTITVNPLPIISVTTASTDETACGESDGTITIVATGSLPLKYSIDGGMNFEQNGGVFTGLAAGSYTIAVQNSLGCITVGSTISISSPGAPLQPEINTFTNPICEGSSISISIKDPDASLTYYWTGPYGFTATGSAITRPNAEASMSGDYAVTAHNGTCVSPAYIFSVKINPLPVVTVPGNIAVCPGTLIPAAILTSTPDGASFTWTIDKPEIGLNATGSSNIPAFTAVNNTLIPIIATITVTPSLNNCVGSPVSYNITVNPLPSATISGDNTVCYGSSANLSVELTGTAPWTITYTDGSAPVTRTGIMVSPYTIAVNPASSKTYTIISVSDANGCSNSGMGSATITTPSAPLSAAVSKTNVTCFGSSTGSISYTVSGGTAPYSVHYSYNSGALSAPFHVTANSGTITGLAAGVYEVTFTDANNCTPIVKTIVVAQPATALAATAVSTNISCSGGSDGTIIISPSGGVWIVRVQYKWRCYLAGSQYVHRPDTENLSCKSAGCSTTRLRG